MDGYTNLFVFLARLGQQAEAQLKRELERQQRALLAESKRSQMVALNNLRQVSLK